jgi:phosphoribosyl-ATP pyrophosphohydrolase
MTAGILARIIGSAIRFHAYWDTRNCPDPKQARVRSVTSEVAELQDAFYTKSDEEVAKEYVDVVYSAAGLLEFRNIPFHLVLQAAEAIIAKNDAKNHQTHWKDANGVVVKRPPEATHKPSDDIPMPETVEELKRFAANWIDTANMYARNADYWRDLWWGTNKRLIEKSIGGDK